MPTLVLRNLPDDLYRRLKEAAAEHRRSMTQGAIVSLRAGLGGIEERPRKPDLEDTLDWLRREVWSLAILDRRRDDDMPGDDEDGLLD